jgi:predicted RNase H-like HicB family nuclease
MSRVPDFPTIQLVQVITCMITRDPSGVLIARSPDIPGRAAFGSDVPCLEAEIRDLIEGHFFQEGETVRAERSRGRKPNDLSTWEVEAIDDHAEQLMAAE